MTYNKAFTLVELLVGVTISMLLMTSVGILVSGGMENILKQQKIMQKNSLLTTSVSDFYNNFNTISQDGISVVTTNSGALFKIQQNIQKGGFGYFGLISLDNQYCPADSEISTLDYLTWKSFIPYEEIGEDIMDNYSEAVFQEYSSGSTTYKVDTLNHKIYENDGSGDTIIVGGEVFGHEFINGADGTDVRLNNPTGIVGAEGGFFFSDTLNHRVLFYEDGTVTGILDKTDGLSEPTGLAYNSTTKDLYIANSGKGEILKYSSEKITSNPSLEISFSPHITSNKDINRFTVEFTNSSNTLISPITKSDYTLSSNIASGEDFTQLRDNKLDYYFADYNNETVIQAAGSYINPCSDDSQYSLNGDIPTKTIITCSSTQTGAISEFTGDPGYKLNKSQIYDIQIDNILPYFENGENYIAEVIFYEDSTEQYTETFKYFSQGDEDITNGENITLTVFANDLEYPTGLEFNSGYTQLKVNDFIDRKEYQYNLNTLSKSTNNILEDFTSENFAQFEYSSLTDTVLENPISNFTLSYDTVAKYFSTNIQYYQYINCYNIDEQVDKTLIFSKYLP